MQKNKVVRKYYEIPTYGIPIHCPKSDFFALWHIMNIISFFVV